jgi:hypothetical protein
VKEVFDDEKTHRKKVEVARKKALSSLFVRPFPRSGYFSHRSAAKIIFNSFFDPWKLAIEAASPS